MVRKKPCHTVVVTPPWSSHIGCHSQSHSHCHSHCRQAVGQAVNQADVKLHKSLRSDIYCAVYETERLFSLVIEIEIKWIHSTVYQKGLWFRHPHT